MPQVHSDLDAGFYDSRYARFKYTTSRTNKKKNNVSFGVNDGWVLLIYFGNPCQKYSFSGFVYAVKFGFHVFSVIYNIID